MLFSVYSCLVLPSISLFCGNLLFFTSLLVSCHISEQCVLVNYFFSAALIFLINEGCCSPCLARRRKKLSWKLNICQCSQRVNNFVRPVVGQCACVCACGKFFLKTQCSRVVGKDCLVGYKLSTSVQSLVHCLLLPFVRRKHFSMFEYVFSRCVPPFHEELV